MSLLAVTAMCHVSLLYFCVVCQFGQENHDIGVYLEKFGVYLENSPSISVLMPNDAA